MGRCFVRLANDRVQRFFLGQHTSFSLEPDGGEDRPPCSPKCSAFSCFCVYGCTGKRQRTLGTLLQRAAWSGEQLPRHRCVQRLQRNLLEKSCYLRKIKNKLIYKNRQITSWRVW